MDTETIAAMPVAWLRRVPEGYRTPIWRWIVLPASALMLRHYGGVWVSGELRLTASELSFVESRMIKSSKVPAQNWSIPLLRIRELGVTKGIASETLEVLHADGAERLMAARPADFVVKFREAWAARRQQPAGSEA